MGKGIIRITEELLLEGMLLLKGYKLIDAEYEKGKLILYVSSEKIENDEGAFADILPRYRKVDYELEKVEGET